MILTLPGRYFNSIKVRLEPLLKNAGVFRPLFQFHKGAIRTALRLSSLLQRPNFNSIKVRLELKFPSMLPMLCCYFNSIKVRLEPNLDWLPQEKQAFQFHKGAIRTLKMPMMTNFMLAISIP